MRRTVAVLLLALLALMMTGCGGDSGGDGVATLSGTSGDEGSADEGGEGREGGEEDPEAAAMEFAQCMRENGVPDFPDPEVDDEGRMTMRRESGPADEVDRAIEEKAMKACGDILEDVRGSFSEEDRTKMQDQFLKFAQCMREQGIDMPDPDFSGEGGGAFRMEKPEDPEAFEKAQEACKEFAPGGGPAASERAE